MRILCDQHVAEKYVRAFEATDWITVATVRDMLEPDASDDEIIAFAATETWVVFTNDDDFYRHDAPVSLLVYSQIEDPDPGDVVEAIGAIDEAYPSDVEVVETVPGGWI